SHAVVDYDGRQYTLTDLGSTHGTTLNGERLHPRRPYPLRPGDQVALAGQVGFRVVRSARPAPPLGRPTRRTSPLVLILGALAVLLLVALVVLIVLYIRSLPPSELGPVTIPPVPTVGELGTSNLYIEYILDASGSMNETLPDDTVKLAVAQRLLTERLQAFRPETHIGLRAYGHRVHYEQREESCQDIELIAPVEVGQLPRIVSWLQDFQARGMTPLAQSIREATADFVFDPARINSIVMLSDGIETCEGDPCGLVRDLRTEGIYFTIHVIGLDVDEPTRQQLMCIAEAGQGTYHDARSEQELDEALKAIEEDLVEGEVIVPPGVDTPTPTPTPSAMPMPLALTATPGLPMMMVPTSAPPSPSPTFTPVPPSATVAPAPPTVTHTPMPVPLTATPTRTPMPATSGGTIAFASNHEGNWEIYLVDPDGSNQRRLTNTAAIEWHPAWSPDGTKLVFQCLAEGISNVCQVNADGRGYAQLSNWKKGDPGAQRPVWSPDGQRIAVSREPAGGGVIFIWVMDRDGSNQTRIVEGRDPSWSPDGTKIAFIRYDGSALQIWTASPEGTNVQQLTEGDADHMYPTWSPDGRHIAFEYDHEQVALINAGGGRRRIVANQPSWNLSWAPDGKRLVIASSGGGIRLINVDGSGATQILGHGTQPAWQPVR
ncbi:MAG: FHA domain-containing protein, partial [Anaerolineae bacterium]